MRALALLALVAAAACTVPDRYRTRSQLVARRHDLGRQQLAGGIALGAGVVTAVLGSLLLARGMELRALESTADTEGGLGHLLGGMALAGSGALVTLYGGVAIGLATGERSAIDVKLETARDGGAR